MIAVAFKLYSYILQLCFHYVDYTSSCLLTSVIIYSNRPLDLISLISLFMHGPKVLTVTNLSFCWSTVWNLLYWMGANHFSQGVSPADCSARTYRATWLFQSGHYYIGTSVKSKNLVYLWKVVQRKKAKS